MQNHPLAPAGRQRPTDPRPPGSLVLEDRERVFARIDEPRRKRVADVRDPVNGSDSREVAVENLDAARTQLLDLGAHVVNTPRRLVLLVGGPVVLVEMESRASFPHLNQTAYSVSRTV